MAVREPSRGVSSARPRRSTASSPLCWAERAWMQKLAASTESWMVSFWGPWPLSAQPRCLTASSRVITPSAEGERVPVCQMLCGCLRAFISTPTTVPTWQVLLLLHSICGATAARGLGNVLRNHKGRGGAELGGGAVGPQVRALKFLATLPYGGSRCARGQGSGRWSV